MRRINFGHTVRGVKNDMAFESFGLLFQPGIDLKKVEFAFDREGDDFIKFFHMPGIALERVPLPFRGQVCGLDVRFGHSADVHKLDHAKSHASGGDKSIVDGKIALARANKQRPPVFCLPSSALDRLVTSGHERRPRLLD